MRLASLVRKTTLENLRDWKVLVMTLSFAPFFTVLMHFYFESASESAYRLAVVNGDEGLALETGTSLNRGEDLITALREAANSDGGEALRLFEESDSAAAVRTQGPDAFRAACPGPVQCSGRCPRRLTVR